jgi:hypothetical protein
VLHLRLIIFLVGGDIPIDSDSVLVTDFMNLKIKLTQSFRGDYIDRVSPASNVERREPPEDSTAHLRLQDYRTELFRQRTAWASEFLPKDEYGVVELLNRVQNIVVVAAPYLQWASWLL